MVRIPAKIDVVEYLGHEELIHAQSEGHEIVALVPSDKKVQAGEERRVRDPGRTSSTSSILRQS